MKKTLLFLLAFALPLGAEAQTKRYLENAFASNSNHGNLTADAPASDAVTGSGWTVGNEASNQSAYLTFGTERGEAAFAAGANWTWLDPAKGNCLRTEDTFTGNAGGSFNFSIKVRASTSGGSQDGQFLANLSSHTTEDPSSIDVFSWYDTASTVATNLSTSTPQTLTGTFMFEPRYFEAEYFFLCLDWRITGAGSSNSKDVLLVESASSWLEIPSGITADP